MEAVIRRIATINLPNELPTKRFGVSSLIGPRHTC
jgi:hypothetical protein